MKLGRQSISTEQQWLIELDDWGSQKRRAERLAPSTHPPSLMISTNKAQRRLYQACEYANDSVNAESSI
jgi:hypothetical protein